MVATPLFSPEFGVRLEDRARLNSLGYMALDISSSYRIERYLRDWCSVSFLMVRDA